jgi:hypothetical protein|tara:strand:+ start:730 stop:942 length:213 start_codon:yes stop_codon:yes gene_type:complete
MKFLNLKNPQDLSKWDLIITDRSENLHECQSWEDQSTCKHFEQEDDGDLCCFTLATGFKRQCELLPREVA